MLSLVMVMTAFVVAVPVIATAAAAEGDIVIDGVSQTRVVSDYESTYVKYAADYLGGSSKPTDIVIPGLDPDQDYVIQGIAYYPQKDWMLVTSYHNAADGEETQSSKVFVLDNKTGEFYAMISFTNPDYTTNTDHGGGIAVSEYNLYYACNDTDRKIAYAPLSEIENLKKGEHKVVHLAAEREFYEVGSVTSSSKTAYTAYVCCDEGILWTGNFYTSNTAANLTGGDYGVKANNAYNSMVWGYELSGSSSEEEWENLMGATGADCQGNPSYVVGVSNNVDEIQYAVVDNGKLYMSSSYGTGTGNWSTDKYSHLTVADIDLSVPGTQTVTFITNANGDTRTVNTAYGITWYQSFDFMPMSEGLCVIDDYVYMTFESACNKYLNESSGLTSSGNCTAPIDVIWKMDQYALLGEERTHDNQSMYYEKVDSLADITDGDEYMIVFESEQKDPVTQNNILYALSPESGLNGYKLTKRYTTSTDGYIGAVGKAITEYEYDIENGILYLNNPEKDDVIANRWTISGANSGNLRIKSSSTYFANYRQLYINQDVIAMTDQGNSDLNNMVLAEVGNGNFYLHNNGAYLWCNDFTVSGYETKANTWYQNQAALNDKAKVMYGDVTEVQGTFHPDGLSSTNIIGQSVGENTYLGEMQIYKRVIDYYSDTVESRVYTDLSADLQADGTYTVTMDTYATDPIQYTMTDERPTDFILMLDASGSMTNNSDVYTYTSQGTKTLTYADCKDYYIYYEGEYCALERHQFKTGRKYYTCVTFRTTDNREFHITADGITDTTQMGGSKEGYCDTNGVCVKESGYSIFDEYTASHGDYEVFTRTSRTRLEFMKESATAMVDTVAAASPDHRISVVTFGSDGNDSDTNGVSNKWRNTGIYTTDSTSLVGYESLNASAYAKAFYGKSDAATLKSIINSIDTTTGDPDTFVDYGFEMANQIIFNSGNSYLTDGERNVCIIMVTDGVPGSGIADKDKQTVFDDVPEVANRAISLSKQAKQKGAYVFACQLGNNSPSNFSMNNYLEYVSSNYPVANSLTDSGSRNTDYIDYHIDVNLTQESTENLLVKQLQAAIKDNTTNAAAVLTGSSVLKQQLSDAFFVPDDVTVTTQFVPGYFDAIDRLTFKDETNEATGVTTTVDKASKSITVTGYDYGTQYIASKHAGNKLRVTITGVLANEDGKITNTSINNTETTAIYEKAEDTVPFKYFPREFFSIPEYTYVLDYGLQMLDTDVNGTLCAVSDTPSKQNVADYTAKKEYTQKSANGLVEITENSLDLLYTTTPTNFADRGFCLIKRDDGSYDWFSIKVVPASNVLYEEGYFTDGATGSASWSTEGTAVKEQQSLSDPTSDVYGYDDAYAASSNSHSNGTVLKATVGSTAKRSATKTFEFIGSGFDLVSACGPNTGIMIVKVDSDILDVPKAYVVDTYYSGTHVNDNGLLCQTPIVSFSGSHGTYTVETTAAYLSTAKALQKSVATSTTKTKGKLDVTTATAIDSTNVASVLSDLGIDGLEGADFEFVWFDDNSILNGGTGAVGNVNKNSRAAGTGTASLDCYIDGVRVYSPMGDDSSSYIDTEKNARYINVINSLKDETIGTGTTTVDGIAYIENALTEGTLSFSNYQKNGPQNELYLNGSGSDALVLKLDIPTSDSKVQLGLRAVNGTATVKIGDKQFNVNSATEMYYDITDCISMDGTTGTITIQNTGSGVLAVNNIKLTGDVAMALMTTDDMSKVYSLATAQAEDAQVVNGVVKPVASDDAATGDGSQDGSDSSTGTGSSSSSLSILEKIFEIISQIISQIFEFIPVGEVK